MRLLASFIALAMAASCAASPARAQEEPEALPPCTAGFSNVMLRTVSRTLDWETPTSPVHIAGPIYFVGTKGLGVYLIKSDDGLILLNTGMPRSGPMIEAAIRALKFDPKDIKWLLANHAHVDHVGAHAYFKKMFPHIRIAIGAADAQLLRTGGRTDFLYGDCRSFEFGPIEKIDRTFSSDPTSAETFRHGGVTLRVIPTPGHTRGSVSFMVDVRDARTRKPYRVLFLDGTSVNPGYRVGRTPHTQSYCGIDTDFARTFARLAALQPDIWLTPHAGDFGFASKRERVAREGADAWVDRCNVFAHRKCYRRFVARHHLHFRTRAAFDTTVGQLAPARKRCTPLTPPPGPRKAAP